MNKKSESQVLEEEQSTSKKNWQTPQFLPIPNAIINGATDSGPDAGDMLS